MFKIAKNNRLTPRGSRGGYLKFLNEFTIGVIDAHRGMESASRITPAALAGFNWRNRVPSWEFTADGMAALNVAAVEAWNGRA